MKSILLFAGTIILFSLGSCVSQKDFIIESDYSYRGKFRRYKTFDFMSTSDTVGYNGLSDTMIRDEIMRRLESQGYKFDRNI
mgnify:CR=1 FL=1